MLPEGITGFGQVLSPRFANGISLLTGVLPAQYGLRTVLEGVPVYPSADVKDNQFEQNYFGVLALQGVIGSNFDYQFAPFSRYSTVSFKPNFNGDLIYNGAASKVFRSDWRNGFQLDTTYRAFADHTIRAGGYFDAERTEIHNHEWTFPIVGELPSNVAVLIVDNRGLQTWIYSLYAQDERRPIEPLRINLGVRFDLYDGLVRADQASPRVAVEYTPIHGTTLHAAYARYFTPPPTELVSVGAIACIAGVDSLTIAKPATLSTRGGSGLRRGFANTGNLPYYVQIDAGITKRIEMASAGAFELRAAVVNLNDRIYQNPQRVGDRRVRRAVWAAASGLRRNQMGNTIPARARGAALMRENPMMISKSKVA